MALHIVTVAGDGVGRLVGQKTSAHSLVTGLRAKQRVPPLTESPTTHVTPAVAVAGRNRVKPAGHLVVVL